MAEKKEEFSVPTTAIFVPVREAGGADRRGVARGSEPFYSSSEMSDREAAEHGTNAGEERHQPAAQTRQIL